MSFLGFFFLIELLKHAACFAEVKEKLPNFEVHGSEIESRTHVFYGDLALRLDYPSNNYELDPSTIPPSAEVTEIWIRRKPEN